MKRMLLLTGLLLFSVCILGQNSDIVTTILQVDGYTYVKGINTSLWSFITAKIHMWMYRWFIKVREKDLRLICANSAWKRMGGVMI